MEDIADYLFDNSDDFKECHYLALMNLLSKVHTKINHQPIYIYTTPSIVLNNISVDTNTDVINNMNWQFTRLQNISSDGIIVSETEWAWMLRQHVLNNDVDLFFNALRNLIPSNYNIKPDAVYKYQFIFPESLNGNDRQKIHIMGAVSRDFGTNSKYISRNNQYGGWNKKISVFVRNF
jgi:hypothetical protein